MGPKKSGQSVSDAIEFETTFAKFCREADVQVIPAVKIIPSAGDVPGRSGRTSYERADGTASLPPEFDGEESRWGCGVPPPVVRVSCDRSEFGEFPVAVTCKAIYVEYSLVRAIFDSLTTFSSIVTLKIEDCCIGREVVSMLASALCEFPGNAIVDLSLDGNADIADELPSLLQTGLKYLSLRRCGLDDSAVSLLSRALHYTPEREQNLLALNLSMNCIGDDGALALATALRTNRTLVSLSVCGNRITDVGAAHLADVLLRFCLTPEECIYRRRRIFERLLLRRSILLKLLDSWRLKTEEEGHAKMGVRSADRISGKRGKNLEALQKRTASSLSSRDKKRRLNTTRLDSREKIREKGRRRSDGHEAHSAEPSSSEMKELALLSENETPPDGHPFITEVTAIDSSLCCDGCWSLGNLQLSHNRITEESIDKFLAALYHRAKMSPPGQGFLRLVIQPGNLIPHGSPKLAELECVMNNWWRKRGNPADGSGGG